MSFASNEFVSLKRATLAFVLALVAVVAINAYCDPSSRLSGQGVDIADVRDRNVAWRVKPFLALKYPHDGLMIGSSRIFYVDPTKVHGFRFYNAGQPYLNAQRIRMYLDRMARDVKLVVIGYDFDMFLGAPEPHPLTDPYNKPLLRAFPESAAEPSLVRETLAKAISIIRNLSYLISADTLGKSVAALLEKASRPVIYPAGNIDLTDALNFQFQWPGNQQVAEESFDKHLEECCATEALAGLTYNRAWLADVAATRDLLADRHIRTVVIITPIHERVLARYLATGHAEQIAGFRSDICGIFPQSVDLVESNYSASRFFFPSIPYIFCQPGE